MTVYTEQSRSVSIIIAVKELNDNLKECLDYCLKLNYPYFEIIVFPDEQFSFPDSRVRVIPTGNITPSKKRDFALKEAKSDILAFIDDDAYPDRLWLERAVRHFANNDVAAVAGPAVTPREDNLRQKASGEVYNSILVSGGYALRYRARKKCYVDDYPSCNFIIRKSIFQELGGFKVNFWPGEDTFLCLGIVNKLNKRIVYDPEVLAYHHRRPLFVSHLNQIANYALHRGYFAKRFPQTSLKFSYFLPSLLLLGIGFGAILSLVYPFLKYIYLLTIFVYLLLVFIFSITKSLVLSVFKFMGIIATHFVYGLYFIIGLFSKRMKEELL